MKTDEETFLFINPLCDKYVTNIQDINFAREFVQENLKIARG